MLTKDKQKLTLDENVWKDNIYYQNNQKMFMEFVETVVKYQNCIERMLKKEKFKDIVQQLHIWLSFLDNDNYSFEDYGFSEIIHLILNGITSFPLCEICGNSISSPKMFASYGFMKGCTRKCSMAHKAKSFKQTCLDTYGVEHYIQNKEAYEKYCDKLEEHHGVRNSFQLESSKKQIKATKKKNYGDENYVNAEKAKQTRHSRYDGKWESDESKTQRKMSFIDHYGVDNNMKSPKGLKAYEDAIEKKYGKGIRNISQVASVKQKKIDTCQKNFGVDYPQQSPIVQKKTQEKCIQKYGYANAIQSPEVRRKAKSKYFYNDIFFDSAPELAYYIWLIDNYYEFEYHPNISFKYEYDGQICMYQPDFNVNGELIEIKGDHFFKEDGTMQNPYDHSRDAIAEAKHQCMIKNNVKILRHKDYIVFIKYVKQTYGASYLQQFKCKHEVNSMLS